MGEGKGVYDRTAEDAPQAMQPDPNNDFNGFICSDLGSAYFEEKDLDRIAKNGCAMTKLNPFMVRSVAYCLRGMAWYMKNDYDKTVADCTEAIKIAPYFADPYEVRAAAYGKIGGYDQAIEDYTHAIKLGADYAFVHKRRGMMYDKKGGHDLSIAEFNQAIQLDPGDCMAYYYRGTVYLE